MSALEMGSERAHTRQRAFAETRRDAMSTHKRKAGAGVSHLKETFDAIIGAWQSAYRLGLRLIDR